MEQPSLRFVHIEPCSGACIAGRGMTMHVKVDATDSGGELAVISARIGPGEGPPLHVHERENECYYVLRGLFEFVCGDRHVSGGPGTVVFAPRQEPHRYKNIGDDDGDVLFVFTPGGIEGFFARSARESDLKLRSEIAREYGITMLR